MAQRSWTRQCLIVVVLLCLGLPGCSFIGNLPRTGYLLDTYPTAPVAQNFTCVGRSHEIADEAVKACFGGLESRNSLLLAKERSSCVADCKATLESDKANCNSDFNAQKRVLNKQQIACFFIAYSNESSCEGKCPPLSSEFALLDDNFFSESQLQGEACDPSNSSFTKENCVDTGLKCAAATRDSYADFLNCREDFQTGAGVGIAALAAAAAPVTVGASAVAGVALAGAAAGGLGLDYIVHNSLKSAAYATAATQLQCVIYDSSNIAGTLEPLQDERNKLAGILGCKTNKTKQYQNLLSENAIAGQRL
jgi:hypothetical protein